MGNKRGEGGDMLCNAIFVFVKQIFHFGIDTAVTIPKIEFANNFFHRGIKNQTKLAKVNLEDLVAIFWLRKDTLQTHD